jgi:hypothetical protein
LAVLVRREGAVCGQNSVDAAVFLPVRRGLLSLDARLAVLAADQRERVAYE